MKIEVKKWLDTAEDDLRKAKDNVKIKNYDLASFLCQQTIEKALKAVLIQQTGEFPRVHDLVRLGNLVKIDAKLLKGCERLTFIYTETRYPDIEEREYTKEETMEDIKIAEQIIKWAKKKIS